MTHDDWWQTYFDERFSRIYRARLPEAEARREVGGMMELLGLPVGSRVLDLACGWGRHAVPLAQAGYEVTGLDLSRHLLAEAQEYAGRAGVEVRWVRGDMREIGWEGEFDAVLSLFSSLGYWLSDEEDLRVLRGARRALRPGGCILLETMHRDSLVRSFAPRDWWEDEEGAVVRVEREFDPVAGVSRELLRWEMGGSRGEKYHQLRVRSATEWGRLLREGGFEPEEWYGGWRGRPFTPSSPRLLVRAGAAEEIAGG